MITTAPLCVHCRHLDRGRQDRFSCAAYPDGVPPEILESRKDHHFPLPGDQGIQFEPEDEVEYAEQETD